MQNYSQTQLGNIIAFASMLIVLFGGKPFSPDEMNALVVVIGIVGNLVGVVTSWIGRQKKGDLDQFGRRLKQS